MRQAEWCLQTMRRGMNGFLMRVAWLSLSFGEEISGCAKESSVYIIKCMCRLLGCASKGRARAAMAGGIPAALGRRATRLHLRLRCRRGRGAYWGTDGN